VVLFLHTFWVWISEKQRPRRNYYTAWKKSTAVKRKSFSPKETPSLKRRVQINKSSTPDSNASSHISEIKEFGQMYLKLSLCPSVQWEQQQLHHSNLSIASSSPPVIVKINLGLIFKNNGKAQHSLWLTFNCFGELPDLLMITKRRNATQILVQIAFCPASRKFSAAGQISLRERLSLLLGQPSQSPWLHSEVSFF